MQSNEAQKRRYLFESAIQETKDIDDEDNNRDVSDDSSLSTTEEDVYEFESTSSQSGLSTEQERVQSVVARQRRHWGSPDYEHFYSDGEGAYLHSDTWIGYDDADWSESDY